MIAAIHQPNFLPNLGFFHKMQQADIFIIITNIQFEKNEGWQRRHKIRSADRDVWLTVPVTGSRRQMIKEVEIDNTKKGRHNWQSIHKKSLEIAYKKYENWEYLRPIIDLYDREWTRLVDLNFAMIKKLYELLEIKARLILDEEAAGKKQELLINVCNKYGAKTYLSGIGGKDYMTEEYFTDMKNNDIKCEFFQSNTTAEYPYTTLHYLAVNGIDWVKNVINR